MIKFLSELTSQDLKSKKVLLRVDFDVPVSGGLVGENFRIESHKKTLDYLLKCGANVLLVSHINTIPSFNPVVEQIGELLEKTLTLVPLSEVKNLDALFKASPVLLLDNIRQDKREEENDNNFALGLSEGFDYYINDAFAVCHRKHALVVAITKHLPSYAGFLIEKETNGLSEVLEAPEKGKVLVMGGAKISTKLPVIKNFLDKAEKILIGGALANDFFKFSGVNIGRSLVDDESLHLLSELGGHGSWNPKIVLPEDVLISEDGSGKFKGEPFPIKDAPYHTIVDIGPETSKHFADTIKDADLVIWNGPMGKYEIDKFAVGTAIIAEAVAGSKHSVIGGGDTIAAVDKLGLLKKMSFVSTGGGAMLDFLAGEKLPGLVALGYY